MAPCWLLLTCAPSELTKLLSSFPAPSFLLFPLTEQPMVHELNNNILCCLHSCNILVSTQRSETWPRHPMIGKSPWYRSLMPPRAQVERVTWLQLVCRCLLIVEENWSHYMMSKYRSLWWECAIMEFGVLFSCWPTGNTSSCDRPAPPSLSSPNGNSPHRSAKEASFLRIIHKSCHIHHS